MTMTALHDKESIAGEVFVVVRAAGYHYKIPWLRYLGAIDPLMQTAIGRRR